MKSTFYIIDAHALIYRFWFAPFANLTSPTGEPTKATYQFIRAILKLARTKDPTYLAVAFDADSDDLLRRKVYPEYKRNRTSRPVEISTQSARILQICKALGICTIVKESYEADDIIATLSTSCVSDDVAVVIATGDKDLGALLVDPRITLYDIHKEVFITGQDFIAKKGYLPQVAELALALIGDSSDNIPPIGGIGEKTASLLLTEYKTVEALLAAAREGDELMTAKVRSRLITADEDGSLARNLYLARLMRDVPLGVVADELLFKGLNVLAAEPIFKQLAFKRWYSNNP